MSDIKHDYLWVVQRKEDGGNLEIYSVEDTRMEARNVSKWANEQSAYRFWSKFRVVKYTAEK